MNTDNKKRQEWLERRRKGIGASDVASILGLSPFNTAIGVYMDKLGLSEDKPMTEHMENGLLMEPFIIEKFKRSSGKKTYRPTKERWSTDYPFLFATPDALIAKEKAGLECKFINYNLDAWLDGVPHYYMLQCQHQMLVYGYEHWYLAAQFGGNRFQYYHIKRDNELIDIILPKLKAFWFDHVKAGKIPEPQHADSSNILMLNQDMLENDEEPLLLENLSETIEEYNNARDMVKQYKQQQDQCANIIKQALGSHKYGRTAKYTATWSKWTTERFDSSLFKKEHPDLFQKYIRTDHASRLSLKTIKES